MSEHMLDRETMRKIDKLVERVARKAGYSGQEEMTYKEHLQAKFEQQRDKLERKFQKYRHKFNLKSRRTDFAEEIKTYLRDGLVDLMKEGYSEEEALKMTMDKFDEAELNSSFEEFMREFDGFGMEEYVQLDKWYRENGDAIGLFYGAFLILGLTLGAFFGYLGGHSLVSTGIGLAVGCGAGIGLGLLSNGIIVLIKRK
ncbi:hypothetical protein [Candidatus Formimonas warabiya]|uniref:Uncharacterized protein n=1 Tax=Formimonas warabiya TaxID=1761012 RepID=A0A3G1KW12_FORW1|nr:hypothetical protein [Candidatus Formimonas warabiya]ATW26549.1 hypothetical protein DCMF_18935 [Candidatus Formimonas warabiya]